MTRWSNTVRSTGVGNGRLENWKDQRVTPLDIEKNVSIVGLVPLVLFGPLWSSSWKIPGKSPETSGFAPTMIRCGDMEVALWGMGIRATARCGFLIPVGLGV
jgi:hypothetical protein